MLVEINDSPDELARELSMVIHEIQVGEIRDNLKKTSTEMKELESGGKKNKLESKKIQFNKLTHQLNEIESKGLDPFF
jgi:hypothetical protein